MLTTISNVQCLSDNSQNITVGEGLLVAGTPNMPFVGRGTHILHIVKYG